MANRKRSTLMVSCGTCRHPQAVKPSHVVEIDSSNSLLEFVTLKMASRHWIKDTFGDGQWHGWVVADRADVAEMLFPVRRRTGAA